ncbi:unnamed protein product, partial [marine sediment metagenome]
YFKNTSELPPTEVRASFTSPIRVSVTLYRLYIDVKSNP